MAYTAGSNATSSDIKSLKTSVNAEMARRKYSASGPSLASYNDSFSNPAEVRDTIKIEHFNKTVGYINKIKATGLTASQYSTLSAINTAVTKLNTWKTTAVTASTSDCSSGCTGLCYTGCGGTCTGCSGTCSTTCTGGCSGGCGNNCTGGCGGGCKGTCKTGCGSTTVSAPT